MYTLQQQNVRCEGLQEHEDEKNPFNMRMSLVKLMAGQKKRRATKGQDSDCSNATGGAGSTDQQGH